MRARLAAAPLGGFGAVVAWWGWKSGGYFEVTYLPGTIALLLFLAAYFVFAPWEWRLRGPALAALLALIGLAAWTLTSGLWSPIPAVAFSDTHRVLAYVAAFAIGIWTSLLLNRRTGGWVRRRADRRVCERAGIGKVGVKMAERSNTMPPLMRKTHKRIGVLALLGLLAAMALVPVAARAQDPLSDPTASQYQPQSQVQGASGKGSATKGTNGSAGVSASSVGSSSSGSLPFTGADMIVLAIVSAGLVASGLALRRMSKPKTPDS
jgi:hypothetical protein